MLPEWRLEFIVILFLVSQFSVKLCLLYGKRLTLAYWVPFAHFLFAHALYVFTLAHFTLLYYNILLVRTII